MSHQAFSDRELWQYCRQDDIKAYNELFDRYYPKLYRLTARYIKETMTAEELSMDLLYNLWQKRHALKIAGEISPYLFRSMRNLIIDHLRKNIPVHTSIDLLQENELSDSRLADHDLLSAEVKHIYHETLNQLSPQRRKVFHLSREENLTYTEIAKEMNLSVNTVENYMVAALNALRKGMNKYSSTTMLLVTLFISGKLH